MCVGACGEAGVAVTKVFGDLIQRAALVEEQRGARVSEVVAAEVGDAGALESGDPDAAAPVVPTQVAALAVGEDQRLKVGSTAGEVELDELARDRLEQLRLSPALRLRRCHLAAGDGPLDAQALAWAAAVVEDVAPHERVCLSRPQALVGEDADERGVLRVELRTDRFDCLRRASVDRLGAGVRDAANADDRIPAEPSPFQARWKTP